MQLAQDDFRSTRSHLQEIAEDSGYNFLLYPKFHCELNWTEYYWGSCNHFVRKHCNCTLAGELRLGAREVVPQALESVKGSVICKYREQAYRGVAHYRERCITLGIDHPAHETLNQQVHLDPQRTLYHANWCMDWGWFEAAGTILYMRKVVICPRIP